MYHDKVKCTSGYLPGNYSKSYIEYTSFIVLHQSIRNCRVGPCLCFKSVVFFSLPFLSFLIKVIEVCFCMFFNSQKHEFEYNMLICWNNVNNSLSWVLLIRDYAKNYRVQSYSSGAIQANIYIWECKCSRVWVFLFPGFMT